MAFEQKERLQKYRESSVKCLQNKAFPYSVQCGGNLEERFPEQSDGVGSKSGGAGAAMEPDGRFNNTSFGPPMCQQDFYVWSASRPDIQRAQQNHFHAFESHFYPTNHEYCVPMENQFHYLPFRTSPHGYRPDVLFQEFHYFVVIDFEATCDKDKNPHPQEIIEFPSVLVNSMTGQLEDFFQIYVRPTHNQNLSDFCKELTGIQQNQVDKGVLLSEALLRHDKWLEGKGIKHTNFAVVTWSNWDCRVMLESECRFKRIRKPPYFNRWINLKVPFHEVFGAMRCNLKEAVQLAGLAWEGRLHCGLDDAKNTARLLANMMHRGFRFSITNSLMWQSSEHHHHHHHPLAMHQFQQPYRVKHPFVPLIQFHPVQADPKRDRRVNCFCGVKSSRRMVRKPGPKHGSFFFGCGNWTATRGALCPYFEWAAP